MRSLQTDRMIRLAVPKLGWNSKHEDDGGQEREENKNENETKEKYNKNKMWKDKKVGGQRRQDGV
jgi:hypothetical protein